MAQDVVDAELSKPVLTLIKYAMIYATGDILTPALLQEALRSRAFAGPAAPAAKTGAFDLVPFLRQLLHSRETEIYRKISAAVDRVVLEEVMEHVKNNQVQASELLGISRTTLRTKLQELGLIEKHGPEKRG